VIIKKENRDVVSQFGYILKITPEEKEELKEELSLSSGKVANIDITDIYKVPFEKVIDLIRGRKVYLKAGKAYITHMDLSSVFLSHFRDNLIKGLEVYIILPDVWSKKELRCSNLSHISFCRLQESYMITYRMTKG